MKVVQLNSTSVDPLEIRELNMLKAAAGKQAYFSRTKWLHI